MGHPPWEAYDRHPCIGVIKEPNAVHSINPHSHCCDQQYAGYTNAWGVQVVSLVWWMTFPYCLHHVRMLVQSNRYWDGCGEEAMACLAILLPLMHFPSSLCLFCSVLGTALPIPDQSGEEEIDQDIYESLGADEGRRLPGGSSAPPPLPSLPPPRTSLAFFPPPSCPAPPPPIEGITRCGEVKDHTTL